MTTTDTSKKAITMIITVKDEAQLMKAGTEAAQGQANMAHEQREPPATVDDAIEVVVLTALEHANWGVTIASVAIHPSVKWRDIDAPDE